MSPRCNFGHVSSAITVAAVFMLSGASGAVGADAGRLAVNRPLNSFDAAAVERAKAGAARKLQDRECLKILTDFKDGDGTALDQRLETWGLSAADYLRALPFRDGSLMMRCRKASIEMVTSPGRPPVFLCPAGVGVLNSRFARVQVENPALAESMVIHEMLHTLGLGENPPSSFEITEQVRERCR